MASIFHTQKTADGGFLKKRTPLFRQPQTMVNYLFDLVKLWRIPLLAFFVLTSAAVVYTHAPSQAVARNLITFQLGNAVQIGMVNPMDLQSMLGQTDKIRDRQLTFLSSYGFARMLAEEFKAKPENHKLFQEVAGFENRDIIKQLEIKEMVDIVKDNFSVHSNGDNNVAIDAQTHDKDLSLRFGRFINQFAIKTIKESQLQNLDTSMKHLGEQIAEHKLEIDVLNAEMLKFKKDHNLLSTQTLPDALRNSITSLSKALLDAEIQLQENEYLLKEIDNRARESGERVLATTGVGFHDQVLEARTQELKEQKALLNAKVQGIKRYMKKENDRFEYVAGGEEKINQLKIKMNVKYDQLNQTELKLKSMHAMRVQVDFSIRAMGDSFLIESNNGVPLYAKLILLNTSLVFLSILCLFYWYEFMPVLSYRDPLVANLMAQSVPLFNGKDQLVETQAKRLCAQNILKKLPGPGMHQIISSEKGDGKSTVIQLLATELALQGEKVCIVDLSGAAKYDNLPSSVKVHTDVDKAERFLQEPSSIKFLKGDAKWVLVDSNALSDKIGHLLVSPYMDGIIFVGSYLQTNTDRFSDWHNKIEQIAGKKAVFVLNKTDLRVDLPFLLMAPADAILDSSIRKVS